MNETIFALATAPGRAPIAIIRGSGPRSTEVLRGLVGSELEPRRASLRRVRDPLTREVIDEALVLWFPKGASHTGEDAFELHLHGGPAVIEAVGLALLRHGVRLAHPGEFSRRAFEAGRLSLTQAEAVADLVDAETDAQRRQALKQLDGESDRTQLRWRSALIEISGLLEAQVDFPDEDLPETSARVRTALQSLLSELVEARRDRRGERVREGLRIALIGAPNAGKSSLLNGLIGRDAAIVTEIAGTTRDVIEAPLTIEGYRVLLADTAGIRESVDPIEREGVRRARAWAASADLRMLVIDQSTPTHGLEPGFKELRDGDVVVLSKGDLALRTPTAALESRPTGVDLLSTSIARADGLEPLRQWLAKTVIDRLSGTDAPVVTRERHRLHLVEAETALQEALESLRYGPELAAEDVRRAQVALRGIAGEIGVEDVLGNVFSTFCIGK